MIEFFLLINFLIYPLAYLEISNPLEKFHRLHFLKEVNFVHSYSLTSSFSCAHLTMETESGNDTACILGINKEAETDDLIAELCLNAPNDRIKFCIRNYQYGRSLTQLERDFDREKREVLCETANYLQVPNYESKTKKSLAHLVICRIQNLLPDDCALCNKRYRISNTEKAILECAVCGQGVHKVCWLQLASVMPDNEIPDMNADNFKTIYNPLQLPGIFYICDACKPTVIPNEEDGNLKRTKGKKAAKSHVAECNSTSGNTQEEEHQAKELVEIQISNSEQSTNRAAVLERSNDVVNQEEVPSGSAEADVVNDNQPEISVSQMTNTDQDQLTTTRNEIVESNEVKEVQDSDTNEVTDNSKSQTTCRFFLKGNCKYGMRGKDCKFLHPKVCSKLAKHGTRQPRGCNKGQKCKFFHPKMCLNSLRKGECFNEECKFNHVKGTKRHPPVAPIKVGNGHLHNKEQGKNDPGSAISSITDRVQYGVQYPPLPPRFGASTDIGNTKQSENRNTAASSATNSQGAASSNDSGHFLEVISLLKTEILQTLNQKISAITAQIEQIQQAKSQPRMVMIPQPPPPAFPPYPQQQYLQH